MSDRAAPIRELRSALLILETADFSQPAPATLLMLEYKIRNAIALLESKP